MYNLGASIKSLELINYNSFVRRWRHTVPLHGCNKKVVVEVMNQKQAVTLTMSNSGKL